jgi:hypothetical protein
MPNKSYAAVMATLSAMLAVAGWQFYSLVSKDTAAGRPIAANPAPSLGSGDVVPATMRKPTR